MILEKRLRLTAPADEVWSLVNEIDALGRCIPGLEELVILDDRHFDSIVRLRLGPISARFHLSTSFEVIEPPTRVVLVTEGIDRGIAGRVRQRQTYELAPDGDETEVSITSEIQISGRFATFGQRVIAARADAFADEVAVNVARLLEERRAQPA